MKAACPRCHGTVQFSEAGGPFDVRCANCDWNEAGTVSYSWSEMRRAELMPVTVARGPAPVPAATVKCMRDVFVEARRLPLNELAAQLSSDSGLMVGTLRAYRISGVTPRLVATGVQLMRVPDEDDEQQQPRAGLRALTRSQISTRPVGTSWRQSFPKNLVAQISATTHCSPAPHECR